MKAFDPFPGDDPAALDAAARSLLTLPLEFAVAQLCAEPAAVHDHWGATHTTVAFVRPSRDARFVRCDYASDHGVYALPELASDACVRAAVKAFVERFAYAPTPYCKRAYTPIVEARMAPVRPGHPPYVVARATVAVGDDAAAVFVFTAPEPVFGRFARTMFGPLVVAIADVDGADPARECVYAGCADGADDVALAELVARMRRLAVERARGDDVVLRLELREVGARALGAPAAPLRSHPLVCATAEIAAHAGSRRILTAHAAVMPIDAARERFNALLCGHPDGARADAWSAAGAHPGSVPLDRSIVTAIELLPPERVPTYLVAEPP